MGLEEIIKRTAERAAAGVNQTYPVRPPARVASLPVLGSCAFLGEPTGETKQCPTCSGSVAVKLFKCGAGHGDCSITKPVAGSECCRTCSDHSQKRRVQSTSGPPDLSGPPARVGVAIGSFRWPELVELQIKLIRDTNGPVPILVSNDDPDSDAALRTICAAYPDVTYWPNPERIGHTGGDIAVFWKAIQWAAARSIKVVAKLSQRFLITDMNWLHEGADDLLASGLPLATQRAWGTNNFDLRTEACLLDVAQWNTPAVLSRIVPRKYWRDLASGLSAEKIIYRVLEDLLGGYFLPWSLFPEERKVKTPGVIWHNANDEAAYHAEAARFGVKLPDSFHAGGWEREHAKGTYDFG